MLPFIVFISKGGDKCLKCIVMKKSEIISDEKHLLDITRLLSWASRGRQLYFRLVISFGLVQWHNYSYILVILTK